MQVEDPAATPATPRRRVFTEQDFKLVSYKEARLTRAQFEQFKKTFIGKPVPEQDVPTDHLLALGYQLPQPWIQCCIEEPMFNWS